MTYQIGDLIARKRGNKVEKAVVEAVQVDGSAVLGGKQVLLSPEAPLVRARIVVEHEGRLLKTRAYKVFQPDDADLAANLTDKQVALADAYQRVVDDNGLFDQSAGPDGAHYMAPADNPFKASGMACENCVAYVGGGGCKWVDGQIAPKGLCKLWIIAEDLLEPTPLDEPAVKAAATFTPPAAVRAAAKRAVAWIEDGKAGDGFTAVGAGRARDLAAGRPVSLDTVKRIANFLSRHQGDKKATGFNQGEDGYPSAGRVAWDAWGGDPAIGWANKIIAGSDEVEKAGKMREGQFVRWDSSGGPAQGRIEHIMEEGVLGIPESSFKINAEPDDPAVLIRIYKKTAEGWRETPTLVGHKSSTLTVIEPLAKMTRFLKQANEDRFTLAPWYIPSKYDAQNEWTDAEELQKALWDYVRGGDRTIRLQHDTSIAAGEWVEAMTLPYEWSVPVRKAGNATGHHTYPAGTVLLGVVWEPWAWDMVKKGEITGFSIGGSAERIDLEIPA